MTVFKSHNFLKTATCTILLSFTSLFTNAKESSLELADPIALPLVFEINFSNYYHFITALLGIIYAFYYFHKSIDSDKTKITFDSK